MSKEYLGDAVYAEYDGYGVTLTTEDGVSTTNQIYLEPEVLLELLGYVRQSYPMQCTHAEHCRTCLAKVNTQKLGNRIS